MTAKSDARTGPFDSLRDYLAVVEDRGRLLRIDSMDQDRYEATGFAYRLIEERGFDDAPPFLIERIRINGEWMDGPVLGNVFGGWDNEALTYGIPPGQPDMYRAAFDHLRDLHESHGGWPRIAPVETDAKHAPCKDLQSCSTHGRSEFEKTLFSGSITKYADV